MDRRSFLRSGAALAVLSGTTGCLSQLGSGSDDNRAPPVVENSPNGVYVPSHVEGMKMAGMTAAGPYKCARTVSFPHRFLACHRTEQTESGRY